MCVCVCVCVCGGGGGGGGGGGVCGNMYVPVVSSYAGASQSYYLDEEDLVSSQGKNIDIP